MKKIVLAAIVFAGTLFAAGGARAADTRTYAQFTRDCYRDSIACRNNVQDYLHAAADQGLICLPQGLSLEEATGQELDWLRKQADADDKLNDGSAEDAQWTAISTLWPCKKDESAAQGEAPRP